MSNSEPLNPRAVHYAELRGNGKTMQQAARLTSISLLAARWLEQDEEVRRLIRHGQHRRMFPRAASCRPPYWERARAA